MRLPVETITEDFEALLRNRIEHNMVRAEIRKATLNDIEVLRNIHEQAWRSFRQPFHPISEKLFLRIFSDPDTAFLIARVDSVDGGFVLLDLEGESKEYGVIAGLGIIPEFQRKGLGTVLGIAAWDYFKAKGVKELRCEVHRDNRKSYSFIKWLGFEEIDKSNSTVALK
jgi:ribosomal protein S18 acetylase RimI-like enzyme